MNMTADHEIKDTITNTLLNDQENCLEVSRCFHLAVVPPELAPEQMTAPFRAICVTAGGGGAPLKLT